MNVLFHDASVIEVAIDHIVGRTGQWLDASTPLVFEPVEAIDARERDNQVLAARLVQYGDREVTHDDAIKVVQDALQTCELSYLRSADADAVLKRLILY